MSLAGDSGAQPGSTSLKPLGMRKNGGIFQNASVVDKLRLELGKQWHQPKKAFRPTAGQTSYSRRSEQRTAQAAVKAKEKEMKEEKEAERNRRIQAIKDRREAKAEKERYEQLAEKMHRKRVERLKRREKRNKLLNS